MTAFVIQLTDGRSAQVQADDVTTRADGSIWALRAVAPKPAPLAPVAVFAARQWSMVYPQGEPLLVTGGPPAKPEPPIPRFA